MYEKVSQLILTQKSLIKIFHEFLPSLHLLLHIDNSILYDNIHKIIKENTHIKTILNDINDINENIEEKNINEYITDLINIYNNVNLLNNILELYIHYINFDIFDDLNLDISNTQKKNLNVDKNNIILEYNTYLNVYSTFNNNYQQFLQNYIIDNYSSIDVMSLLECIFVNLDKNYIFINLNKNTYLDINEMYFTFNINKTININNENCKINNTFIDLYIMLINVFYSNELQEKNLSFIDNKIEQNKNKIFKINNINPTNKIYKKNKLQFTNFNNLQTFQFKPVNLNINIDKFLDKYCNIKSNNLSNIISKKNVNINNLSDELYKIIKLFSNKSKTNYAIFIIKKVGNVINYDINNLINHKISIHKNSGINKNIISKNNMISNSHFSQINNNQLLYLINYSEETENILVFDTINFNNFRVLTNNNIYIDINNINIQQFSAKNKQNIFNLINNKGSSRINNYNSYIEKTIINKINTNSLSDFYTKIASNFDIYDDDTIYNKLTNKLLNNIMSYVKKNKNKKIYNLLFNDDSIIDIFTETLYEFYFSLSDKKNIDESYLTYLSNVEYIINKFRKDIFDNYIILKNNNNSSDIILITNIIKTSIENIINTKTHIYDNMIEKVQLLKAFN